MKRLCPSCSTFKAAVAFRHGAQICAKCLNLAKNGKATIALPPAKVPQSLNLPSLGESKEEESHIDRCKRVYYAYIKQHPNEFHEGDHITIIDHENVPRKFGSYEEAVTETDKIAGDRNFFYAEYLHENDVLPAYNTTVGKFRGTTQYGMAYIDVEIKNSRGNPDPHTIEMLVDTGAGPCIISKKLASDMKAREMDDVAVGLTSGSVTGKLVEMNIKVGDLEYRRVKTVALENANNLLGMSYLKLCHQTWHGDQSLKIRLLKEDEKQDVEMGPHLLESMEKLNLNLHAVKTEKETLEIQAQEHQAKIKNHLEEIRQLQLSLIAASRENELLESVLKNIEEQNIKHKGRRKI